MGGSGKGHLPILVHVFWLFFQNAFHLIFVIVSVCCYYHLFSSFLTNISQFIFFDFCHISVCCCYHCGEKRLVNSIPFFIAMTIMMVIVDGEQSSTSLSFWVCEAVCQSLAAMDIVVIVTAIAVVYSSSITIMGG